MTLAFDLSDALVKEGANFIQPADTIEDTLDVIMSSSSIDGAVLGVNLQGEVTFAAAEHLVRRQIPFVFLVGHNSSDIPDSFKNVDRCEKPLDIAHLIEVIDSLISAYPSIHPAGRPAKVAVARFSANVQSVGTDLRPEIDE
ncbi:response regulator [Mesorhizobium temperatum]|uniref:response regulator n=1 Tax=Mesorhizobium temperatum TaxID=241416 RepID=UPI00117E94DE|nr:response regulator [Mesorhizobium temperatum]